MSGEYGIDAIIEVIDYGIDLGDDIQKAKKDGKIDWKDAPLFIDNVTKVPAVIKAAKKLKDQFLDMDDSERETIRAHVKEKVQCENDQVEEVIEKSLILAINTSLMFESVIDLANAIKDLKANAA